MSDATITKYVYVKLADSALYAMMQASQSAAAASAASAASAATTAVNAAMSGTANTIAKFTGSNAVGNSLLADDGTTLSYSGPTFQISNNAPFLVTRKVNAPTDQKFWRQYATDTQFIFDAANDAYSAAQNYYVATRSGNSVTTQQWFTGGVERMRIDSGGRVGIGAAPGTIFDVVLNQNASTISRVMNTDTGSSALAVSRLHCGTSKYVDINVSGNSNYVLMNSSGGIVTSYNDFDVHVFRTNAGGNKAIMTAAGELHVTSTNSLEGIKLTDISANGANIKLTGNGATPSKWVRVLNGNFEVINNAYSASVLSLSDAGVLNLPVAAGRLQIAGTQVVGPRDTGWAAMTGSTNKNTTYDTSTVTLAQLAGRVMALQAALTTHGLIGA